MDTRILLALKSCWTYSYKNDDIGAAHHNGENQLRSTAIRKTWYKDWSKVRDQIDLRFFYGRPTEGCFQESNSVSLDCPDDYPNLPLKVRKIFEWALDNEYTNVLLLDDDVYVFVDRLLADIESWKEPPTYRGWSNGWFASGAAYWIDRHAMQCVLMEPWKPEQWAEDQYVGKCLEKYGIAPEHDERYNVCHCDVCLKKADLNKRITQHTPNPEMIYALHNATVRLIQ